MKKLVFAVLITLLLISSVYAIQEVTTAIYGPFSTNQVSIATTSSTLIKAGNADRNSIMLQVTGSYDVYIGSSSSVTTSNGKLLSVGTAIILDRTKWPIYGIASGGTSTVDYLEE